MNKYAVIYEPTATGYSPYAPDLPGCIATGQTVEQTRVRMTEAIEAHLQAMREDGDPIPEPSHSADMLELA
jgi:predicted RNase H-like HicB family nuclease